MPNVIEIKGLGKKYIIRHQGAQNYSTLRDQISDMFWNCFKIISNPTSLISKKNHKREEFWALKDITFPVQQGERIGIIGKNGAGKSTLLKILSRVTDPTVGRVRIRGRVSSLLEVGTGFHPELTGRENIYLNGAILGMSRADIKRKFDEIVTFSEIEKFLDTPVKRYSSGMFVRLAFGVVANLEPEILIVDEVLAVGDIAFQRKCLGKMNDVANEGRTVLFVSHNMHAITNLCEKVIWLDRGKIKSIDAASKQVARYCSEMFKKSDFELFNDKNGQSLIHIKNIRFIDSKNQERDIFDIFEPFAIELDISQKTLKNPVRLVIRIRNAADDSVVLATTDWDYGKPVSGLEACNYLVQCSVPKNLLNNGTYFVSVGIDEPGGPIHMQLDNVKQFSIVNTSPLGEGIFGERDGVISPYQKWKIICRRPLQI